MIISFLIGIILIIMGFIGWRWKLKAMFCGIRQINVDVDKYVRFMGITTILTGVIFLAFGIFVWLNPYSYIPFFVHIGFVFAIVFFSFFAERKCKLEDKNE